MILSGRDIQWYIKCGKLKIEPVELAQFQQNGIDLILKSVEENPLYFTKGKFCLGVLRERISMPNDLMAFVELRSTWARRGIMIPPTIIDAGFVGDITLELVAFTEIEVPIGKRFAHVVFAKLTSDSEPYSGKYQNQTGITPAREDLGQ